MEQAPEDVKQYIQETFRYLLNIPTIEEWVDSHAGYGTPPATYYILERLTAFVQLH